MTLTVATIHQGETRKWVWRVTMTSTKSHRISGQATQSANCSLCNSATLNVARRPCKAEQVQSLVPSAPAGLRHKGKSQMAGPGSHPRTPRLRSQLAWHCCLWLLTHSRWLRDERPQASWKINQAMHTARVGVVRAIRALGSLVSCSNMLSHPLLICTKNLPAQAGWVEFWENEREDRDPQEVRWGSLVLKQVGSECCLHKKIE